MEPKVCSLTGDHVKKLMDIKTTTLDFPGGPVVKNLPARHREQTCGHGGKG